MEKLSIRTYVKIRDQFCFAASIKEIRRNTVVYNYNDEFEKNFVPVEDARSVSLHYIYEFMEGAIVFIIGQVKVLDFRNYEELLVLWSFLIYGIMDSNNLDSYEYSFGETNGIFKFVKSGDVLNFYFDEEFKASCPPRDFFNELALAGEKFVSFFIVHRPDYKKMENIYELSDVIKKFKDKIGKDIL